MSDGVLVVMALDGRAQLTEDTVYRLHGYGGAHAVDMPRVLHWTGPKPPSFPMPAGWTVVHETRRDGHRRDLWRLMRDVVGDRDLVLFEDDVAPCLNAALYISRWDLPHFTTFHNMMRRSGLQLIDRHRFFWGIQSVKIPARLVARFIAAGDTDARPQLAGEGGDTRFGRLLMSWDERIYHHKSLVQHVGEFSVGNPGARLAGIRAPAADFDERLDALTLGPVDVNAPPWELCDWPGGCLAAALPGEVRCDAHMIRRRRPKVVGRVVG